MNKQFLEIIHAPEYFSFHELIHTDTGLNNVPEYLVDVRRLVLCTRVLNYIRQELGFPISINSGFRSADVNRKVGGVSNSNHLYGRAFDIRPSQKGKNKYQELLHLLQDTPLADYFDEIIPYREKGFVHISINIGHLFEQVLDMVEDRAFRLNIIDLLLPTKTYHHGKEQKTYNF